MSSFAFYDGVGLISRVLGSAVGAAPLGDKSHGLARLPTDPIGTSTVTLSGIVVGSSIHVETQAGSAIENRTASSTTEVFSIPAYSPGNASNSLRIKVRKGSAAPFYQPFETQALATVGAQSIFVAQIPD